MYHLSCGVASECSLFLFPYVASQAVLRQHRHSACSWGKYKKEFLNPEIVLIFSLLVELYYNTFICQNTDTDMTLSGLQLFGDVLLYVPYTLWLDCIVATTVIILLFSVGQVQCEQVEQNRST